mmetsp:Transcript_57765/g.159740  ORF Transcript_57765/g.159740 Transcript_57765/m.159740 type:complete len:359 (-) Transcript_57765:120-1196(-)
MGRGCAAALVAFMVAAGVEASRPEASSLMQNWMLQRPVMMQRVVEEAFPQGMLASAAALAGQQGWPQGYLPAAVGPAAPLAWQLPLGAAAAGAAAVPFGREALVQLAPETAALGATPGVTGWQVPPALGAAGAADLPAAAQLGQLPQQLPQQPWQASLAQQQAQPFAALQGLQLVQGSAANQQDELQGELGKATQWLKQAAEVQQQLQARLVQTTSALEAAQGNAAAAEAAAASHASVELQAKEASQALETKAKQAEAIVKQAEALVRQAAAAQQTAEDREAAAEQREQAARAEASQAKAQLTQVQAQLQQSQAEAAQARAEAVSTLQIEHDLRAAQATAVQAEQLLQGAGVPAPATA